MNGIPLLATGIYTLLLLGGVAGIIYGLRPRENHQGKNYFLIVLGIFALACVAWGLISRHLIITNSGDISALLLSRNVLGLIALVIGLALLYWRFFGKSKNH